jgi:threonyl-tRNA synthetase
MDIVYKRGALNQADALSRRPDLRDSLQKLRLKEDWTTDEAEEETNSFAFFFTKPTSARRRLLSYLREAHKKDPWLTTRRNLPSYLIQHPDGLYRAYRHRVYIPDVLGPYY